MASPTHQVQGPLDRLLSRRTWAGWIDVLMLFIVGVIISIVAGQSHFGSWTRIDNASGNPFHPYHYSGVTAFSSTDNGSVTHYSGFVLNLAGVPFLLWVAVALLYHFIAELLTGRTIGKWMMGLKVTTVDGQRAGVRAVLLRTLGRIVDVLPFFYLVGWLTMRRKNPPQRLGDSLAGTTVILTRAPEFVDLAPRTTAASAK